MRSEELLRRWQLDPQANLGVYIASQNPAITSEISRVTARLFPTIRTSGDDGGEFELGEDPRLTVLRNQLTEYYPLSSRKQLQSTAIGYVLLRELTGYAGSKRETTAIGINFPLETMLFSVYYYASVLLTLPAHTRPHYEEIADRITAYASTLAFRYICSSLGKCLEPFPFGGDDKELSKSRERRISITASLLETALAFIVAHEMSHISLGHTSKSITHSISSRLIELEADKEAARVVALWLKKGERLQGLPLELHLGAIAGVVAACDAIGDTIELFERLPTKYPTGPDRFGVVAEEFHKEYDNDACGTDLLMNPFLQASYICEIVESDPEEAFKYLGDMQGACMRLGDAQNAVFISSLWRFIGRKHLGMAMSDMDSAINEIANLGDVDVHEGINTLKI